MGARYLSPRRLTPIMSGAAAIAAALNGHKVRGGWLVRCPAHDDSKPSLSIADGDISVLLHCFAGCERSAIIAALRSRGLWPENRHRGFGRAARLVTANDRRGREQPKRSE